MLRSRFFRAGIIAFVSVFLVAVSTQGQELKIPHSRAYATGETINISAILGLSAHSGKVLTSFTIRYSNPGADLTFDLIVNGQKTFTKKVKKGAGRTDTFKLSTPLPAGITLKTNGAGGKIDVIELSAELDNSMSNRGEWKKDQPGSDTPGSNLGDGKGNYINNSPSGPAKEEYLNKVEIYVKKKSELTLANKIARTLVETKNLVWNPLIDKIKLNLSGGVVSLSGDITWGNMELLRQEIVKIPGVSNTLLNISMRMSENPLAEKIVINENTQNQTDITLAEKIKKHLAENALVEMWSSGDTLLISVKSGRVTLEGAVTSADENSLAGKIQEIPGVESVDIKNLKISKAAAMGSIKPVDYQMLISTPSTYNLLEDAYNAKWRNDQGELLRFEMNEGAKGNARYVWDVKMRDAGRWFKYRKALMMNPRNDSSGEMIGDFMTVMIPPQGAELSLAAGLNQDSKRSDGVAFSVRMMTSTDGQSWELRGDSRNAIFMARKPGELQKQRFYIQNSSGEYLLVRLQLRVNALRSAEADNALWVEVTLSSSGTIRKYPNFDIITPAEYIVTGKLAE